MKLIVDIDDKTYETIKNAEPLKWDCPIESAYNAIKNGTPHEREKVLDKIRAEIEQTTSRYSISRERGEMGQVEWSDNLIKESEVLKIIDKYKSESELKEE